MLSPIVKLLLKVKVPFMALCRAFFAENIAYFLITLNRLHCRFVLAWSDFFTTCPALLWAPWPCWTSSLVSSSRCPASWSSPIWMMPSSKSHPAGRTRTACCSSRSATSPSPAQPEKCVRASMRWGTCTMPTGERAHIPHLLSLQDDEELVLQVSRRAGAREFYGFPTHRACSD